MKTFIRLSVSLSFEYTLTFLCMDNTYHDDPTVMVIKRGGGANYGGTITNGQKKDTDHRRRLN